MTHKKKRALVTSHAPKAIGPYSQAMIAGPFLYCSGQIPIDPKTGQIVGQTIEEQTHQVMKNILGIIKSMGLGVKDIVKATIFLKEMSDFSTVNGIYGSYLEQPYPARSTVAVKDLPLNAKVEIEVIALV